jgi:hypothetical protein
MSGLVACQFFEILFGGFFVELGGFTLFDGDRIQRAAVQARTQPVAVDLADQAGLAVDQLDRAFGTGVNTPTAAVTFFFINLDNVS